MSDCCDVPRENAFDLAYADLLPRYDTVAYIEGQASFTATGSLEVDGKPIDAPKVIIATGSRPRVPEIPGIDHVAYLTSTTALELEQLPESLLVMGGGYVGAEIAQLFARAGVNVTLVSRRGLLPEAEPDIGEALTRYFTDEGIKMITVNAYTRIETTDHGIRLHVQSSQVDHTIEAENVLVATGRSPNSDNLNLAAAGIETHANNGGEGRFAPANIPCGRLCSG